jgi:bromodomain-containing factor 1
MSVLTNRTLGRLYDFMIGRRRGSTAAANNRSRKPPGTKKPGRAGTGGVNRTTIDEEKETERIRQLQSQLESFDRAAGGGTNVGGPGGSPGQAGAVSSGSDTSSSDDDSDSD